MKAMKFLSVKVLCPLLLGVMLLLLGVASVGAEEDWQGRFEEFCARAGEVMNLTPGELQGMLAECETYRTRIEALPESPRKVYRKRLSLSCNMVQFALQQKSVPPPQE